MNLGELIDALKKQPGDLAVYIDGPFGLTPGELGSYRGYYDDLAIGLDDKYRRVDDLVKELESAVGKTFTGYKGGTFRMGRDTTVWIANYGSASGAFVTGVKAWFDSDAKPRWVVITWGLDDDR